MHLHNIAYNRLLTSLFKFSNVPDYDRDAKGLFYARVFAWGESCERGKSCFEPAMFATQMQLNQCRRIGVSESENSCFARV